MLEAKNRPMVANHSLLDTRTLSSADIVALFREATVLRDLYARHGVFYEPSHSARRPSQIVCCLFFEPSTRTRMSFQTAAYRLGHQVLNMEPSSSSSLSKGETYSDTVENIVAMSPDALVIRYGHSVELDELLPRIPIPVINAGSGISSHPTQALLDAYTIQNERGSVGGARVLIVGDIKHSRVARSNFDVLLKLGAEVAVCGPQDLMPNHIEGVRIFDDLDEAISWCDVYMGLRIQIERHHLNSSARRDLTARPDASERLWSTDSVESYHERFGLSRKRLAKLRKEAIIMHPGPINHGVEFSPDVMQDSRNRVLSQVSNGVLIRAALLSAALVRHRST